MAGRPNVVWITLDSIRADRTSLGGYDRETTPRLDRIAASEEGVALTDCFAHAIWSLPSITSMLTGTYPTYHGTGLDNEVLPGSIETVAERFGRAGWRTAALSLNPFCSTTTGLDRGFEEFTELLGPKDFLTPEGVGPLLKFALNVREHSAGFSTDVTKHRQDYVLNELVKKRVASMAGGDEPLFLYAHYQGAHYPYYPPLSYQEKFTDEIAMSTEEAREFVYERTSDIYRAIAEGREYTDEQWAAIDAMYDASVAHSDALVGDLFERIQSLDIGETVFVVTADHGDLLGEGGFISHNLLAHDALLHVPAVVHGSAALADRGENLCQHVDLIQTITAEAGVDTDGMQGVDLREEDREYAVAHRGARTCAKTLGEVREHDPAFDRPEVHESLLTVLRTDEFKYQHSDDRTELFDLPDETTDVSEAHPEVLERFREWHATFDERYGETVSGGDDAEYSEEAKSRLSDLGYVVE